MDKNDERCKYSMTQAQRESNIIKVSRWVLYSEHGDMYWISNEKPDKKDTLIQIVGWYKDGVEK